MSVAMVVSWSDDKVGAPGGGLFASVWAIVEMRVWLVTPAWDAIEDNVSPEDRSF